ncbi:MAG: hypothetical protein K9J30_09420 [Bacteroidales bacterium]|nr:hypothetical protein [Bacteroidales bacterium]
MFRRIFSKVKHISRRRRPHADHSLGDHDEFAERARRYIELGMKKIGNEAMETREMARSFFKLLEHKLKMNERTVPPTEEEVLEAIEQLKDVGRFSVFTTAVIIPGGAVSLIGLELLARKFGIKFTFIPSSFRKNAEWKHPDGHRRTVKSKFNRKGKNISNIKPM